MPFDSALSIAIIVITFVVLMLRTHMGLNILLVLSSYFLANEYGEAIHNYLASIYEVFSSLAFELLLYAVIVLLPVFIALIQLRGTVNGRVLHQLIPSIVLSLLVVTVLSSLVYDAGEFSYVRNSYLVGWLQLFQGWILGLSFIVAFVDILSHYGRPRGRRRFSWGRKD